MGRVTPGCLRWQPRGSVGQCWTLGPRSSLSVGFESDAGRPLVDQGESGPAVRRWYLGGAAPIAAWARAFRPPRGV